MDSVLVLDPGNHTGWLYRNNEGGLSAGTLGEDHFALGKFILELKPAIIVYETFQLYPSRAAKMNWNSFYPCEVIGIIKFCAALYSAMLVGLPPSSKKFAAAPKWLEYGVTTEKPITEHMRDAWRLYDYWLHNKEDEK